MTGNKDRGIARETARRLSRDLTAGVVVLVLVASALAISSLYLYASYSEQKKLEQRADEYLAYLRQSLVQPLWSMNNLAVGELCLAFAQNQELARIMVKNEDGKTIFIQPAKSGKDLLIRRAKVEYQGQIIGYIEIGMDPALYQKENWRALVIAGFTVLAVVVMLLALTGGLVHRLLARFLDDFQRSIERISSGDYEAHKGKIRYQEMERIVERFNHMAARVKRREDSLTLANEQLQDQIAERRRAEEALAQSEQRYRQLFDSITDFIYTHDLEGRFTSVNQGAAAHLGYDAGDLLGRKVTGYMLPQYAEAFYNEYLPAIIRDGKHEGISVYLDSSGGEHYVEYRNILVTVDGEPNHVSGMGRDVTERLHAQDQLRHLEEQLRQSQKMEAVGTLAGGVAHDFNNILQGIRGYAQIISMGTRPNEPMRGHVDQIEAAVGRASELVQQLLTFSRRVRPKLKPVDLNQCIKQAVALLERTLPKMVTIRTELAEGLNLVNADSNQLGQVILNLGANASDAMPDGGELILRTSKQTLDEDFCHAHPEAEPGDYVRLEVKDTGQGMDPVTISHIFDPFFTTKELGKGTGLGLSIVYGIMRSHGGIVAVESQAGQGSSFNIYLPALSVQVAVEAPAPESKMLPGGGESLLLVDDDVGILNSTRELLEHFGYKVRSATSGEEALSAYQGRPGYYDLVIMDLGMPGMGGAKALEKMKEIDPSAKVIVCSGYSSEKASLTADQGGAAAFVSKPYKTADMLTTIRKVLDSKPQ
jgi:PAS domain S-box-containing protein